jgi:hypothetical protein
MDRFDDLRVTAIHDLEGLRAFWEDDPSIPPEIVVEVTRRLARRRVPNAYHRASAALWTIYVGMKLYVRASRVIHSPMAFAIRVAYLKALRGEGGES